MKKRYFIGIDGGGTKSRLQLEDQHGSLLAKAISGPASIRWSINITWESINAALDNACHEANIDPNDPNNEFYAGMGLAGCEISRAREQFLKTPNRFSKIVLNSDGYTACIGAHDNKDGAIITVGTGVVGFLMQNHHAKRVGGWGFPHGDKGGGAWLGVEAARLTFQCVDGRIKSTPMLSAILHRFDNNSDTFNDWANAADAKQFASLAPIVIDYADKNDPHALQLIKQAAHEINLLYKSMLKHTTTKQVIPCCLFGGIAPFLLPWIDQNFIDALVERKYDPAKGAIIMVKEAIKGHINDSNGM